MLALLHGIALRAENLIAGGESPTAQAADLDDEAGGSANPADHEARLRLTDIILGRASH